MRILILIVLLCGAAWCGPTATLTGRISDPTGAAIVQADVLATNVETGVKHGVQTNEEGLYRILNLEPGAYSIAVEKNGFRKIVRQEIELRVQDIVSLNFELQIGSVMESVTVEGGAPLVQTENVGLGEVIDRNVIAELPTLTRNPYDFVALSAGAVQSEAVPDRGVGVAINGQRVESSGFLLDGAINRIQSSMSPAVAMPNDAIREYRVMTNGFSPEYGRSSGFVANLVTKSGTNQFHGSLYEYARNSWLAANSFENNSRSLPRAVFNRHQGGGTLGSPIRRDKAFFFASLETTVIRSSDNRTFQVPTPDLVAISAPAIRAMFTRYPVLGTPAPLPPVVRTVVPFNGGASVRIPAFSTVYKAGPVNAGAGAPQNVYKATGRVDYTLSQRNSLTARYAVENSHQLAQLRQPYTSDLDQETTDRKQNANVVFTRVWTPQLVTESRAVFLREGNFSPESGPHGFFKGLPITGESATLPTGRQKAADYPTTYQLQQNVNWVHGKHTLRAGIDLLQTREGFDLDSGSGGVRPLFPSLQSFVNGVANVTAALDFITNHIQLGGNVGTTLLPPNQNYHKRYTWPAWFVQDTWKVSRRLTLTPGLRWDYFAPVTSPDSSRIVGLYLGPGATYWEQFANGGVYPIDSAPEGYRGVNHLRRRNNFAPRMALAYDLTRDGKTALRAGGGIFFEDTVGDYVGSAIGSTTYNSLSVTEAMLDNPYNFPAQRTGVTTALTLVDPMARNPYSATWNATVEREIPGSIVLSAAYAGSSGISLYDMSRLNQTGSGPLAGRNGRLLRGFIYLNLWQNLEHSSFHGFQLKAESRGVRRLGLQFGANYSWGHSIDNGSSPLSEALGFGGFVLGRMLDPFRPRLDRGDSSFDQRQRFATYFVWQLPGLKSGPKAARAITSGWQTSGIVSFNTGQPLSVWDGGVSDADQVAARPRITGILPQPLSPAAMIPDPISPNRFLYLPSNRLRNGGVCNGTPFGCYASILDPMNDVVPRNMFRRPGAYSQDVALSRTLQVTERVRLQLRGEGYNFLNHAILRPSGGFDLNSPNFAQNTIGGVVASYSGTPRQVVVSARFLF